MESLIKVFEKDPGLLFLIVMMLCVFGIVAIVAVCKTIVVLVRGYNPYEDAGSASDEDEDEE